MTADFVYECALTLRSDQATVELAELFAAHAAPGQTILLSGPVGAGKSFFARAYLKYLMQQSGDSEDVPSPTFTLVQTYQFNALEVWHADLYRLSFFEELGELGLDMALDRAICLVEWPDRLGPLTPPSAVTVSLQLTDDPDMRAAWITNMGSLPAQLNQAISALAAS